DRHVRRDGFFAATLATRSAAERLAESVVQAACRTPEERQVRHLGYLLAETAVSPDIDPGLAARALQLAESCSWRQLVFLAAVGRRDRTPLPMGALEDEPRAWTAWGRPRGRRRPAARRPARSAARRGPAGGRCSPRLRPTDLRLTRRGVLVHRLLALDFVRDDDVATAVADLDLPPT
ncbi:hypothetical protein A7K94_0218830, partial [Modestobacter sp. VKM Ac-2676]